MSIYGYLTASNSKVSFIYSIDNEMQLEDLTDEFEILAETKRRCTLCEEEFIASKQNPKECICNKCHKKLRSY